MPAPNELLRRIDAYLDGVPRAVTITEEIGPFTLFINTGNGWRYYARPTPGRTEFGAHDAEAVLERQRELAQPLEFEWVADLTPGVRDAAEGAGLEVSEMPLMHLPLEAFRELGPTDAEVEIRIVTPDEDLATATAVAMVGFGAPGTDVGEAGIEALPAAASAIPASTLEFTADRMRDGFTTMAVATVGGIPVASGSHQPSDGATEITGVACLPAYRRRGLGAAVTSALVADAMDRGVGTVFLSAGDEDIARVYERVGFRRVGHVGAAAFADAAPLH
jgi:ribosomal protein S18 acetylase RimI-like enzyme